ncbi:hypothetical protein [Peribacillus sp. NPDC097295]|uniref:hypothetical protein n=1 Tax=Peribacillus sp. NPDC097295 TaxID=3364402 RepID=UPI003807DE42
MFAKMGLGHLSVNMGDISVKIPILSVKSNDLSVNFAKISVKEKSLSSARFLKKFLIIPVYDGAK